ncbi:hypothetical protein [Streptomyces spinosisporus]|uniref:Uncharacterized protein n=1 Tax=Streptomyces spinosisporus TaxID=2927582 RepID=A0ABS9XEG9_9ACTN|nr:hypothetical protein [Streptomyces spinosisporus]MCI3240493.1 hypothetical protein [Streptomyces spinosisporus]
MALTDDELTLLEYIYDKAEGDLAKPVDVWSVFDRDTAGSAARKLQDSGLIELASVADDYRITGFGIDQVSNLRALRSNGPARMAALRLRLIHWLYSHYLHGGGPDSTEVFKVSDQAAYIGQPFSDREIVLAVDYLQTAGLIDGMRLDQSEHLIRPVLTPKGVDCAESEKTVSEFLNPPTSNGPTFNVRIDGSQNVVVGTQTDFTQNNTSGIEPAVLAQLVHFATVAREGIPSYGLDEAEQIEVQEAAQELESEAQSDAPERGRLRRLTDRLVAAVTPAAGSALGGIVTALGEQAVSAISG